jgi:hypothetical protein
MLLHNKVAGWDPATFFTMLVDIVCFLNCGISIRWLDWFWPLVNAVMRIGGWIRSSHLSTPSPELVVRFIPATSCQHHRPNWWLDSFQPLVNAVARIGGWIRSSHLLLFSFLLLFFLLLCVVIGDRCECIFFFVVASHHQQQQHKFSHSQLSVIIYILLYIYMH